MTAQPDRIPDPSPAEYARSLERAADFLKSHTGPLILLAHESPDGDAVGSLLGLGRMLRAAGKDARLYGSVPEYLKFLLREDASEYAGEQLDAWPAGAAAVVLDVDPADMARVAGADLSSFAGRVLNIDHHGTNKRSAHISVVHSGRAATALMVAELLPLLGLNGLEAEAKAAVATPLLLGTITDTGSFRHSNTDAVTLRLAAELLEAGADLRGIGEGLEQRSHASYALQHLALGTLEFSGGGEVVGAYVTEEMLAQSGASWDDAESMIGAIRAAAGTRLAVLFKAKAGGVKLSIRSRGGLSARNIAVALGGGGHEAAAGASVAGNLEEAREAFAREAKNEIARAAAERQAPTKQ